MSESASVDEFIRHMQAELESCEDIVDKVERQKRQWQIESSLLLAMDFSKKFKELSNLGQNPMKIIEALQDVIAGVIRGAIAFQDVKIISPLPKK